MSGRSSRASQLWIEHPIQHVHVVALSPYWLAALGYIFTAAEVLLQQAPVAFITSDGRILAALAGICARNAWLFSVVAVQLCMREQCVGLVVQSLHLFLSVLAMGLSWFWIARLTSAEPTPGLDLTLARIPVMLVSSTVAALARADGAPSAVSLQFSDDRLYLILYVSYFISVPLVTQMPLGLSPPLQHTLASGAIEVLITCWLLCGVAYLHRCAGHALPRWAQIVGGVACLLNAVEWHLMLISETLHQINLDSVTVATIVFYAAKLHHTPTLAHTLLIGAMLLLLALTFAAIECMVVAACRAPFWAAGVRLFGPQTMAGFFVFTGVPGAFPATIWLCTFVAPLGLAIMRSLHATPTHFLMMRWEWGRAQPLMEVTPACTSGAGQHAQT